jgi:hypothetical protein
MPPWQHLARFGANVAGVAIGPVDAPQPVPVADEVIEVVARRCHRRADRERPGAIEMQLRNWQRRVGNQSAESSPSACCFGPDADISTPLMAVLPQMSGIGQDCGRLPR